MPAETIEQDKPAIVEPSVAEGLFAVARAIDRVGLALRALDSSLTHEEVGNALRGLASLARDPRNGA